MQLEMLGWNGFFAGQASEGVPGRVASAIRERFLVWTENGRSGGGAGVDKSAPMRFVMAGGGRLGGASAGCAGDRAGLRRRSVLSRKQPGRAIDEQVLAANIDVLFIVSGLDRDYNERRIERYLVVARQSGARPVILLNKADLASNHGMDLGEVVERLHQWSGVPVLPVSALAGDGLEECDALLAQGETAALIGSSGVGKSTIVNRLLGSQQAGHPRGSARR